MTGDSKTDPGSEILRVDLFSELQSGYKHSNKTLTGKYRLFSICLSGMHDYTLRAKSKFKIVLVFRHFMITLKYVKLPCYVILNFTGQVFI